MLMRRNQRSVEEKENVAMIMRHCCVLWYIKPVLVSVKKGRTDLLPLPWRERAGVGGQKTRDERNRA